MILKETTQILELVCQAAKALEMFLGRRYLWTNLEKQVLECWRLFDLTFNKVPDQSCLLGVKVFHASEHALFIVPI
jgi:hypothetical protein